jgi:histidinol-phosphatase (PHP family)
MHTPLCRHAIGQPEDYAASAHTRGLKGVIVTCHAPMPDGYSANVRMSPDQLPHYFDLVARAAAEWEGRVDVLVGLETDFVPGFEPWIAELHTKAPFHHVLGSVHPFVPEYKARFYRGDPAAYQRLYFEHLALAAETGLFDTLAHPDLIKNEDPASWDVETLLPDICHALDRIAATGTAMELNTSGLHKRIPEMNPGPQILAEIRARNIPVVLGADAHHPQRVGEHFPAALALLESLGFHSVSVFLDRKRREIPIGVAAASLAEAPAYLDSIGT